MKKEIDEYQVREPGFLVFFVAVMLASGASFALATYMLELSSAWVALLTGAVFGALGFSLGENVGDAIIFSLIVGLLVFFFIKVGPEIEIIRAVIVPIATGFCAGKLVYGFCEEIS
jgi:hypothetical protein